jgi:D-serine deaminase-like pyridoxal phosphate-dependent protein
VPQRVADLPTPALIVDLERVDANLRRGQAYADAQGVDLRPHTKTHKGPHFARAQLEAGAAGICVAKLGEAEMMADAGIDDVFMPNTVIGPDKAARAVALAQRVRFAIGVDHPEQVAQLAAAAQGATTPLAVMVEVDVGAGRGGAAAAEVAALLRLVRDAAGLRARGVYAYEGFTYTARDRAELIERHDPAQRALLAVSEANRAWIDGDARRGGAPVVSLGSTPSLLAAVPLRAGITETRPGTYAFNDLQQARWAAASGRWQDGLEHAAAHVLASVVSVQGAAAGRADVAPRSPAPAGEREREGRSRPSRAIVDAGSKALTSDRAVGHEGHGLLVDHGLTVARLSEEHGVVEGPGVERLRVGDKVRILMNHVCPVVNLFPVMHLVRGDEVVEALEVTGRGLLV